MTTPRQFNAPLSLKSSALAATHNSNTIANIFTTGGNVGIGLINPACNLHLYSASTEPIIGLQSATQSIFGFQTISDTGSAGIKIGTYGGSGSISSNVSFFSKTGNFGIGTTAPAYKLDAMGSGNFSTFVTSGALYSTNQTTTNIVATASTITNLSIPGTLTVVNITSTNLVETNITSATILVTGGSFSATHNSNTVANIFTTGGNVGIGTTSPIYTLDVNGTLEASNSNGLVLFNTSGNVLIGSTTPTPSAFGRGNLMLYGTNATNNGIAIDGLGNTSLQFLNSGTMKGAITLVATAGNWATDSRVGDMVIRCATNQSMLFNTNSGTGVSTMIISGGNVGIGTTAPSSALEVNGRLSITVNSTSSGLLLSNIQGLTLANYDAQNGNTANIYNVFGGDINYQSFWGHSFQIGGGGLGDGVGATQTRILNTSSFTVNKWSSSGVFSNLFTIRNSGNVGIGTTAPDAALSLGQVASIDQDVNSSYFGANFGSTGGSYRKTGNYANMMMCDTFDGAIKFRNATIGTRGNAITWNERVRINSGGNVGIGTTSPQHALDVRTPTSNTGIQHSDGTIRLATYVGGTTTGAWFGTISNHPLSFYTNNSGALMTIGTNGHVDITGNFTSTGTGTFSPSASGVSGIIVSPSNASYTNSAIFINTSRAASSAFKLIDARTNGTQQFLVRGDGVVSIGTDSPSASTLLHVASGTSNYNWPSSGYYFNTSATITFAGSGFSPNNSIVAVGGITSNTGFYATSDIRIKTILKQGINEINVDDIDKLTISKFEYIDKLVHGNDIKLGFIAQNVHDVIPEAVTIRKEFVPNIFKVLDVKDSIIELANHNLTVGTRVKIMIDEQDRNGKITMITDIIDENHFCIEYDISTKDKLFVYGTEVDDFKELNYNHIFTLSVGAVQKLRQDVKTLEDNYQKLANFIQAKFPGELTI